VRVKYLGKEAQRNMLVNTVRWRFVTIRKFVAKQQASDRCTGVYGHCTLGVTSSRRRRDARVCTSFTLIAHQTLVFVNEQENVFCTKTRRDGRRCFSAEASALHAKIKHATHVAQCALWQKSTILGDNQRVNSVQSTRSLFRRSDKRGHVTKSGHAAAPMLVNYLLWPNRCPQVGTLPEAQWRFGGGAVRCAHARRQVTDITDSYKSFIRSLESLERRRCLIRSWFGGGEQTETQELHWNFHSTSTPTINQGGSLIRADYRVCACVSNKRLLSCVATRHRFYDL